MADHHKTHNGRDLDGRFRVRQEDVDDLLEDPDGPNVVRDDVRLGGAIADVGSQAGEHAARIGDLIEENRADVGKVTGQNRARGARGKNGRGSGRKRGGGRKG